jgi:hypothetical protein
MYLVCMARSGAAPAEGPWAAPPPDVHFPPWFGDVHAEVQETFDELRHGDDGGDTVVILDGALVGRV